jgi:predicted MPP superfamily phosphohydrolase
MNLRRLGIAALVAVTITFTGTHAPAYTASPPQSAAAVSPLPLPNRPDSVKLVAFGDMGTGDRPQYEVAAQMAAVHQRFPFDLVLMLGDNLYGSQEPADFVKKFEEPYKPLLDAGVHFYATLGNHDHQSNRFYKPFNMDGQRYYTFVKKDVRFFVLDSDYLDPPQRTWIENALKSATEPWKVCFFHHPLYSDGKTHGSSVDLRVILEPLFVKYGVNVVFSGHDHIYERIKPQKGIYYFVSGSGGQLRKGDTRPSAMADTWFDQDQSFMLVELTDADLSFATLTRTGLIVDSGVIHRQHVSDTRP